MSKSKKSPVANARVTQFPIRLAFATTSHKIQGQTVKKPRKVVIDLRSVFQAAMAYVMLSRVESIEQLFILEEFDGRKIYGNPDAIEELNKMNKISVNENPSQWKDTRLAQTRIGILNCGSLRPKFEHIKADDNFAISDVIGLTETWLWENEDKSIFELLGFQAHHNCFGKGRGVSVYYKEELFKHDIDITEEKLQITKLVSTNLDIIIVYMSPKGNESELQRYLEEIIEIDKKTLVCGDFNRCYIDNKNNKATQFLEEKKFQQLVNQATHIDGGHIDNVYFKSEEISKTNIRLYSPYYTAKDHDALLISIKE